MHSITTSWQRWAARFGQRADRPLPELIRDHDYRQLPASVKRSLAIFQLGESGGGRIVLEARASSLPNLGEHYADALHHFVAEQSRHANILAICVRLTGSNLLRHNWTNRLFVLGRRMMGLRLKVMVLLAAEIVGLWFYRALALRLPKGALRSSLLEIVADEREHLEFHLEFLESQLNSYFKLLIFKISFRLIIGIASALVVLDHRRALRDLGIPVLPAWRQLSRWRRFVECRLVAAREHAWLALPVLICKDFPDIPTRR